MIFNEIFKWMSVIEFACAATKVGLESTENAAESGLALSLTSRFGECLVLVCIVCSFIYYAIWLKY